MEVMDWVNSDLVEMVNFPIRIPECDSPSSGFLDFFLSFDANICSKMAFPALGNSAHIVVLVSIDFSSISKWNAPFHCIA